MNEVVTTQTAKAQLALSRGKLLAAMGFEEMPEAGGVIKRTERVAGSRTGLSAKIEKQIRQSLIGRWWHRSALRGYLDLANPFIRGYARREPTKLVACGAGIGALLWLIKPWRLISATTVVSLLLSNSDIVGLMSGAAKKVRGAGVASVR